MDSVPSYKKRIPRERDDVTVNLVDVPRNLDAESGRKNDASGERDDVPSNVDCVRVSRDVVRVRIEDVPVTITCVEVHENAPFGRRNAFSVTLDAVP